MRPRASHELLAARRLDGGRQYFTRAKDFGYSKNAEETLSVWDRQAVLGDIVRVIREFRPDVIITRFSPKPAPTHGHHQVFRNLQVILGVCRLTHLASSRLSCRNISSRSLF